MKSAYHTWIIAKSLTALNRVDWEKVTANRNIYLTIPYLESLVSSTTKDVEFFYVIAYNEKSGEVRSGQANASKGFEHWLIKLDGVSEAQFGVSMGYGRIEMAYYLMAIDCGIEMMECRLLEENDRAHFMTKRYDREGGRIRHHVQTWCALGHYDFNDMNSYSYEQLFQIF